MREKKIDMTMKIKFSLRNIRGISESLMTIEEDCLIGERGVSNFTEIRLYTISLTPLVCKSSLPKLYTISVCRGELICQNILSSQRKDGSWCSLSII
jgi:hypothetical protein